jgi:hypothetical protein
MAKRARFPAGAQPVSAVAGVLLGLLLSLEVAWADDPVAADRQIQAQLAAGEFAPALATARQAADPAQRDAWLGQIAVAQAQSGSQQTSLQTAAEISDDQRRAQTLSGIGQQPLGGLPGGAEADFDSLIQLITSTIKPTTWDSVGGPGSIAPFPTGVDVDSQGVLRRILTEESGADLTILRAAHAPKPHATNDDVRHKSPLRMVSLTRLEREVQICLAAGRSPDEAMQLVAGLYRIKYLFIYPETHDIVLAGPAGDWRPGAEERIVNVDSSLPVVRLDDLVVVLRHMQSGPDARFGCLIAPTQDGLARLQAFLEESGKRHLRPGQRKAWLNSLRSQLGPQDIEVYGLDPRTRAARVMVEADYRMKLVGMGLEEGVPGVPSYLAMIRLGPRQSAPPMGVLRWWFELNYDAVTAAKDRSAFALRGQGVKVLSENEHLTAAGQRVHTGESDDLNREFARNFTEHFEELAVKYPVYAELRNLFDLALVAALIREEGLAARCGWHMTCFGDAEAYRVELGSAPQKVDSVVNCRVINDIHVVAGVSGGVRVHAGPLVDRQAIEVESNDVLGQQRSAAVPKQLPPGAWWWEG